MVGWMAYLVLVAPVTVLVVTHRALGTTPVAIGFQLAGLALVVWARLAFGWRSFYAGSSPTAGRLVTTGPYRFVRNPIYLGVLIALGAAVATHLDWTSIVCGTVAAGAIAVRIGSEERHVAARFPQYRDYARKTRRLIPFVF